MVILQKQTLTFYFLFMLLTMTTISPKSNTLTIIDNKPVLQNTLEAMLQNFHPKEEKPCVIITPSYNNSQWYKQNLDASLDQQYTNYRIIYLDDASPDKTGELVKHYLEEKKQSHKVTLIKNSTRQGALANWYQAIHSCQDHEIVIMVDGDDHLAHKNVLSLINKIYQDPNIWLTYGNFKKLHEEPDNAHRAERYFTHTIQSNSFREYPWVASHLRTCYAWLFKQIKKEDLMYEGQFYPILSDHAMMFPMLEMAGTRISFIPDTLLIYNNTNPLNVHKLHPELITKLSKVIRSAPKYLPLKESPLNKYSKKQQVAKLL